MGFRKTFSCLGKNREWEDQEKGGAHLEAGDQPFKPSTCSPAFSSCQTCGWCVQVTWSWPSYSRNLGSKPAFFHRSDYWDSRACFILVAFSSTPPISIPTNITQGYCLSNALLLHRRGFGDSLILCITFLDRIYNHFMQPSLLQEYTSEHYR